METKFKQVLIGLIFGGIILIAIFPIIGDYGELLFPLGRDLLLRILVEILFFLYLILVFLDRSFLPKFSWLFLFLVIFWFIYGLSTLFSLQPSFSLWGNIFRGHGFFSLTHYVLFFLILICILKTWQAWKKIIWAAIVVSLPITLISLWELFSGAGRIQATLNNPNFYGAYLLLIFFITLAFLFRQKNKHLKFFLIGLIILQFFSLIFSRTRSAYLGLITGSAVFFFTLLYLRLTKRRKIIFLGSLILFAIIIFLILLNSNLLNSLYQTLTLPIRQVPQSLQSVAGRLEAFRTGLLGIKDRPWLGAGPENFIVVSDKYYQGILEETGYPWFDKAHNVFLEIGATIGIFGLLAYLTIWFFAFKSLFPLSHQPLIKIGLLATFVAYLFQNLFNIDTTSSLIYLFLWFGLANFLASKKP